MTDEAPHARSAAQTALREALAALDAHQQLVLTLKAEAARREEERERVILAHQARSKAVQAEARSLLRLIPKERAAEWSPAEQAQVWAGLNAAVAYRLNQRLGALPPVPATEPPLVPPKLRLTPHQRRALIAAQRRAERVGETLLPEGFRLVRPYNKKARPEKATKPPSGRRAARAEREPPVVVTVSPAGAWSLSEDGLE